LLPPKLEERLKETGIGLFILFLIIIVSLIVNNSNNSKNFIALNANQTTIIQQKTDEINGLHDRLQTLRKDIEAELSESLELSKYSTIFELSNKAFAELRDALRKDMNDKNQHILKAAIRDFCYTLNDVFFKIKGVECHVCIKYLTRTSKKATRSKVKTFVRDGKGILKRNLIDKENIEHYLEENSDFSYFFPIMGSNSARHFMCNDLLNYEGYLNSSFKKHNRDKSPHFKYDKSLKASKEEQWPLPYRSVITAPVCPGIASLSDETKDFLVGFLCVDFEKVDILNKIDAEIVSGYSDGLYESLKYYIETYFIQPHTI